MFLFSKITGYTPHLTAPVICNPIITEERRFEKEKISHRARKKERLWIFYKMLLFFLAEREDSFEMQKNFNYTDQRKD